MGIVAGVSFLSAMAYTAFAADLLQTTQSGTSGTTNTTTSLDSGTKDATVSTTDTTTTVTADTTTVNTSIVTEPVTQTTSIQPSVTVESSAPAPTAVRLAPLTAYTVLEGSSMVVSGTRNIFIKTSREIYSAEVVLLRNGVSEHLGQAHFDSVNRRWVYVWDSKMRTQDGSYRLFTVVKSADGVTARSNPIDVSVKNEKVVAPQTSETIAKAPTSTSSIDTELRRKEYLKRIEESKKKKLEEEKTKLSETVKQSAVQKVAKQPDSEKQVLQRTGTAIIPARPSKLTTPVDYEKVINEKSLELKDAVEKGDANKRAAIVAEIVRVARGSNEVTPSGAVDPLAQKVEEGVRKLEQVIVEQEHGVVDEKIFKVERVEVAEVATKEDGTQTASKVAFRGKALPDSFVTLYIFSLPIVVTVKTDADGNWNYTLDKELEDGNHQVYVGITDVKGKVVVKSNPLPFVKTASAITVEEALTVPQAQAAPSFVENNYFYGIVTIIIMFVAYIFIFLGIKMSKTSE